MTLRARLLAWFAGNRRDLPWRRTKDPYRVLVSEVMLQQTQVARVLPAYERFLRRFPRLSALAAAPLGEVLREWSGLGYNRRARDLHRIARLRPKRLPTAVAALDALPGIGRYTASAVACFAHGDPTPFADTNIRRVLGRYFLGRVATEAEARRLDAALVPLDRAADWHHALMDLGATVCVSRSPRCGRCPIARGCRGRGPGVGAPVGVAPELARRRQPPFASSDRRIRGLIVSALRSAPTGLTVQTLARRLRDPRVARLARVLQAEGLVESADGRIRLPG
jgi:A/G-specific adenine glycosylase